MLLVARQLDVLVTKAYVDGFCHGLVGEGGAVGRQGGSLVEIQYLFPELETLAPKGRQKKIYTLSIKRNRSLLQSDAH